MNFRGESIVAKQVQNSFCRRQGCPLGVPLGTLPGVLDRYADQAFLRAQLVRHAIKARTPVMKTRSRQ